MKNKILITVSVMIALLLSLNLFLTKSNPNESILLSNLEALEEESNTVLGRPYGPEYVDL